MLAYFVHDFNPVIVKLGWFEPRWYGFAYLLGFMFAYWLLKRLARQGMLRVPIERVPDMVLNCCIFGVLVGGRMGYCLFYDPSLLGPARGVDGHIIFPYWGVLAVWHGGMSAHGGVIFVILTLAYFSWRNKVSFVNIGDAACMVVPIGLFFGRIANFINGELYGQITTVPWAVKFPTEIISSTKNPFDTTLSPSSPAVNGIIYETAQRFPSLQIQSAQDLIWQLQSGSADVSAYIQTKFAGLSQLPARHPSQLYEALLEGALLFVICWTIGKTWRKDGMASGAFLTLYPIMRIIGEQFRVGDNPQTFAGVTLSLGVWYSLLMFVPGLLYWLYWMKRNRAATWIPQKESPATASK